MHPDDCPGLRALLRRTSLATCAAPLDASVVCGSTATCATPQPQPQPQPPKKPQKSQWGDCVAAGAAGAAGLVVDATRCVFRPEGAGPSMVCDAVDQWPDFAFGELRPWDATFDGMTCPDQR